LSTIHTDQPESGETKSSGIPTWVKILIPLLAGGGFMVTGVIVAVLIFVITAWLSLPLPIFGFDQPVEQPIPFPHPTHAGTDTLVDANGITRSGEDGQPLTGLGLDCTFCHRTVETSAAAGIPPVELCTFCHRVVGSSEKVTLEQLRGVGLEPFVGAINWQRVHRVPDHVRFIHDPHIRALTKDPSIIKNNPNITYADDGTVSPSQVCTTCHGDVKTMDAVKQVEPLKMGQCVNCHRDNQAPTDCAACHY
jgi:hypothetical protein